MREINLIVVHCTASRVTSNLTPESLRQMHLNNGWQDCGYHYYIRKSGDIIPMRDISIAGAHAKGYNTNSLGVCYEGGLDAQGKAQDTRTEEQKQALTTLLRYLLKTYPGSILCGHRDLSPDLNGNGIIEPHEWTKMCPCFDVSTEYKELVNNLNEPSVKEPESTQSEEVDLQPNQEKGGIMKMIWKVSLNLLRTVCEFVLWITDSGKD